MGDPDDPRAPIAGCGDLPVQDGEGTHIKPGARFVKQEQWGRLEEDAGESLTPEARGYVKVVLDESRRMHELIEDLLMLARLESQKTPGPGKPEAVPALLADI